MVVCPVCDKAWPKDHDTCPDDGSWLHEETIIDRRPSKTTLPQLFGKTLDAPKLTPGTENSLAVEAALLADTTPLPKELISGTKAGEYVIEAKIGEGAMGTVYRAVHPTIGKYVAIKVMSHKLFNEPDAMKRFLAEARAVAAIRHPGIVDVFGFGRLLDGRTYLTMEWLEGQSLAARMQRGKLPLEEALDILRQIAKALEAAHAKNIIHRDLKPENVFLVQHGEETTVKVLDFGLAKDADTTGVGVTREGQILGTPLYMSPEQCRSKGVDHRTDIYALGCLGYVMLAHRVPFDQDNAAELISAHLTQEPPRPRSFNPSLPPVMDNLLVRMLAKDPAARPTLPELRRAIGSLLSRHSMPMEAVPEPRRTPTSGRPAIGADEDAGDAPTVLADQKSLESASTAPDRPDLLQPKQPEKPPTPKWKMQVLIGVVAALVIALGIYAFWSLFSAMG